jgi:hypothetical protein
MKMNIKTILLLVMIINGVSFAQYAPAMDPKKDWLVTSIKIPVEIKVSSDGKDLTMANGIISRTWRLLPNAACISYKNLVSDGQFVRSICPEAIMTVEGNKYEIGGLDGQPEHGYINMEWLDDMHVGQNTFVYTGYKIGRPIAPYEWNPLFQAPKVPWPPKGKRLTFMFEAPEQAIRLESLRNAKEIADKRSVILEDNLSKLGADWKIHRGSALGAGLGVEPLENGTQIKTYSNTAVFIEHKLPEGVSMVQCIVDPGTDQSAAWGPGITLVWPGGTTLKFMMRTADSSFAVRMGGEYLLEKGEKGKAYHLRIRQEQPAIFCEVSLDGKDWKIVKEIVLNKEMPDPELVRLGKASDNGGTNDYGGGLGGIGHCIVKDFKAYGQVDENYLKQLRAESGIGKLKVEVHYEMYVGAPLMTKWVNVKNTGDKKVIIEKMAAEQLAVPRSQRRRLHVEADYTCFRMHTPRWELDPRFATTTDHSSNYHEYMLGEAIYYYPTRWMDDLWSVPNEDVLGFREGGMRTLMSSRYPHGPGKHLRGGETFKSFRTFTLLHDNDDRMRQSLGRRKIYRILAPQAQENPSIFHVLHSDSATIRKAVDQCAVLGFDMAILTFGSGFNMRTNDPVLIARYKADFDYAHSKGIKIGGYILFASSASHGIHDAVDPETGQLGGDFGRSLCLATAYSDEYFAKLFKFIDETGMDVLEADGPYHGYVCGAANHKYHDGAADSYYAQWKRQVVFFRDCMKRGIYIHAPDFYYFTGTHRSSMGYRESSVTLPHQIKAMVARRDIFDGTLLKTPSMGWMWDPIAPGYGAHTDMNPLSKHLDLYNLHLAHSFGSGAMYCWRNTVLYDDEASKMLVKKWVDFYKDHWQILQSDILHLRRPDGRDIDYFMHVNSQIDDKGLLMVFNPLEKSVERTINLPLYYAGVQGTARISEQGQKSQKFKIDYLSNVQLPLRLGPKSVTWFLIK